MWACVEASHQQDAKMLCVNHVDDFASSIASTASLEVAAIVVEVSLDASC
jgi:hypothetical protein